MRNDGLGPALENMIVTLPHSAWTTRDHRFTIGARVGESALAHDAARK
jgi:hypothetical protein